MTAAMIRMIPISKNSSLSRAVPLALDLVDSRCSSSKEVLAEAQASSFKLVVVEAVEVAFRSLEAFQAAFHLATNMFLIVLLALYWVHSVGAIGAGIEEVWQAYLYSRIMQPTLLDRSVCRINRQNQIKSELPGTSKAIEIRLIYWKLDRQNKKG